MNIGNLTFEPLETYIDHVAKSIADNVHGTDLAHSVYVAQINPDLADTSSFCEKYNVGLDISTNCLIIEAKRADKTWYAACLVLANDMADINGKVRKQLEARKVSFAPMDTALQLTQMEYGGITPIGLPASWPILIDENVMKNDVVIIGGGIRGSKIAIKTEAFRTLPNTTIMQLIKPQ